MGEPFKRGKFWYVWVREDDGTLVKKSTKQTDKKLAIAWAQRHEHRRVDPSLRAEGETSFLTAIALYIETKQQEGIATDTLDFFRKKLKALRTVFDGDKPLSQFTKISIRKYITRRTVAPIDEKTNLPDPDFKPVKFSTVKKELTVLRGILEVAHDNDLFATAPVGLFPRRLKDDYEPRETYLTQDQLWKLVYAVAFPRGDARTPRERQLYEYIVAQLRDTGSFDVERARQHFGLHAPDNIRLHLRALRDKGFLSFDTVLGPTGTYGNLTVLSPEATGTDLGKAIEPYRNRAAMVLAAVATASRISEVRRLTKENFLGTKGFVVVPITKTKRKTGKSKRSMPITPFNEPLLGEMASLVDWRAEKLFNHWPTVNRDLALACQRAGIPRVSTNDLRRTHGKWLMLAGVDDETIGKVLGHADGRMARRVYARAEDQELKRRLLAAGEVHQAQPREAGSGLRSTGTDLGGSGRGSK